MYIICMYIYIYIQTHCIQAVASWILTVLVFVFTTLHTNILHMHSLLKEETVNTYSNKL